MQRNSRTILTILLFAALAVVSANAQNVGAEDDTWITGSGTQVDFSNFGNVNLTQMFGSQPVNSVVSFGGTPLNSSIGQADTVVSRSSVTISNQFSATLSIKGLSLASSPDLTLQDGRVYHVTVGLSRQTDTGTMNFTTTTSEGGTFSSSFTVTPILTFTNTKNSSDVHTIDCSGSAACSFGMSANGSWVQTSSTGFDPLSMGIPTVPSGVQLGSYTTVGRPRFGGIQVGCGGTKSSGYGCGQNNELHGSIGQAFHGTKPPNDCAPPSGGGGCTSAKGEIVKCNNAEFPAGGSQASTGLCN